MAGFKRFFNTQVPVRRCNLNCHYCYLHDLDIDRGNDDEELRYSLEHMRQALASERLGGACMFNLCAEGETLLFSHLTAVTEMLLGLGHFVTVVTNTVLERPLNALLAIDAHLRERLFIKCSFQFLELKRLKLLERFFDNVALIKNSGTSFSVELLADDKCIEHVPEIKSLCMTHLGALCHVIEARNQGAQDYRRLTALPLSEHQGIWRSFDSPLFDYQQDTFGLPQKNFCYAGELYGSFNLQTGNCKQCINSGKKMTNLYENIAAPVQWLALGSNCPLPHCYITYHAGYPLVNCYAENAATTYAQERDRQCLDGSHWLTPFMRDAFSHQCSEQLEPYGASRRTFTNALMGKVYFNAEPDAHTYSNLVQSLSGYLQSHAIETVAIYGMHALGQWLAQLLADCGVRVSYGIDKRYEEIDFDIPIFCPGNTMPEVDAVIVAAYSDYTNIEPMLRSLTSARLLSVAELGRGLDT